MTISHRYRHFPGPIIQRAVWLYCRFTLSLRDVEDLLAERGIEVSYATIRRWVARFGPEIASIAEIFRSCAPKNKLTWHTTLGGSGGFDHRSAQLIFHSRIR